MFNHIELIKSQIDYRRTKLVEKYIIDQIEELLEKAREEAEKNNVELMPLIRLKIEYG